MKEEDDLLFDDIQLKLLNPTLKIKNGSINTNKVIQIETSSFLTSSSSLANFSKSTG